MNGDVLVFVNLNSLVFFVFLFGLYSLVYRVVDIYIFVWLKDLHKEYKTRNSSISISYTQ